MIGSRLAYVDKGIVFNISFRSFFEVVQLLLEELLVFVMFVKYSSEEHCQYCHEYCPKGDEYSLTLFVIWIVWVHEYAKLYKK